jgi:nucleoside-specific outer membrane channel protein Tsx
MAYKDDGSHSWGVQITPVWSFPFKLGMTKFKFRGFVDIKDGNTNALGNVTMLAQPQLLLDVGDLVGWKSDVFYIGTEYSFWLNKFGVEDANESAWQGMMIGFF